MIFDFEVEYSLREVYFWNYFAEQFDVDEIDLSFYDLAGTLTGTAILQPRLGQNANGVNGNDIVAETIPLAAVYTASRVVALLTGTNGQIDFQNFVFRATT